MMATPSGPTWPIFRDATAPAEVRLGRRDAVRLLVSGDAGDEVLPFRSLPEALREGDLLVVNESGTLAASLPASATLGKFRLNLSTHYGGTIWVAEPRWDHATPGPLPLSPGATFRAGGLDGRILSPFPGLSRLAFVDLPGDVFAAMRRYGEPIRYRYVARRFSLETYQTVFARVAGSAEMPSAGRPFTIDVVDRLRARGVRIAPVLLHAGVSSLESTDVAPGMLPVYPEPFEVPESTAARVNGTRCAGGRVVAVGTTVVRALESATTGGRVRAVRGFTRAYVHRERPPNQVDGLITGLHELVSTHFAMLESLVGRESLFRAYRLAAEEGLLAHEFGDSHLLWRPGRSGRGESPGLSRASVETRASPK